MSRIEYKLNRIEFIDVLLHMLKVLFSGLKLLIGFYKAT